MTAVLLKVALDVAKERNIAYSSKNEETKGTKEDEDSEENRNEKKLGD